MSADTVQPNAGVLEQGPPEAAHLRDAPVEAGGLFRGQRRVQGGLHGLY